MRKVAGARKALPRLAGVLACGLFIATRMSQAAAMPTVDGAEQLHRLDVMLQVTSKHCSGSSSDFRSAYAAFSQAHRSAIAKAAQQLRAQLVQRHGSIAAASAFERMNARLAAQYRGGHPWLDCEELQTVTRGLAMVQGSATLIEAADQILPKRQATRFATTRD
ncbi:hypothetical protein HNO88_003151 [Novosphingobium chloroacetimidivorans]|uniref:S-adenosyl-L-homocysteine hydrolase n=1 Tax=Novosphingobium chloroacetimidivorans TaxID=1428314 RepID=A0A7W7NXU6_9SPHN|nr:S-adenosyl-L-homocysteine hydrolase [Novosphingobium chloroacetimidivorans]MBB4859819.1 hypothetical protein [Novosphingobium chloroacetimidivorans]